MLLSISLVNFNTKSVTWNPPPPQAIEATVDVFHDGAPVFDPTSTPPLNRAGSQRIAARRIGSYSRTEQTYCYCYKRDRIGSAPGTGWKRSHGGTVAAFVCLSRRYRFNSVRCRAGKRGRKRKKNLKRRNFKNRDAGLQTCRNENPIAAAKCATELKTRGEISKSRYGGRT